MEDEDGSIRKKQKMAIRARFERATARLEGECSIQLSYRTADFSFVSKSSCRVNHQLIEAQ
jgi:hypothetical protein